MKQIFAAIIASIAYGIIFFISITLYVYLFRASGKPFIFVFLDFAVVGATFMGASVAAAALIDRIGDSVFLSRIVGLILMLAIGAYLIIRMIAVGGTSMWILIIYGIAIIASPVAAYYATSRE